MIPGRNYSLHKTPSRSNFYQVCVRLAVARPLTLGSDLDVSYQRLARAKLIGKINKTVVKKSKLSNEGR